MKEIKIEEEKTDYGWGFLPKLDENQSIGVMFISFIVWVISLSVCSWTVHYPSGEIVIFIIIAIAVAVGWTTLSSFVWALHSFLKCRGLLEKKGDEEWARL